MAAKKSARKKPAARATTKTTSAKTATAKPASASSGSAKPTASKATSLKAGSPKLAKSGPSKGTAPKDATKRTATAAAERATPAAESPPSEPKRPSAPGVVHWEVQAKDPVKQQTFFADLFGWAIDANNPMNYGMVASGSPGAIGGGIGPASDTSRVTIYVQVPDINAALAKAEALGARTVMPRMDAGAVTMGQFADLEGNLIGLVEG